MQYLLLFHCHNGYTNAPQCYVIRTLPVLFILLTKCTVVVTCGKQMLMYSQPTGILHDCQRLLLPYEIILNIVLNKNEYYITCQGQAKISFFLGGGVRGSSMKQLMLPWP
jgi:hypothetical protein